MFFKDFCSIYIFLFALFATGLSQAQIDRESQLKPETVPEPNLPNLKIAQQNLAGEITVKKFKLKGNTVFPEETLLALLDRYLNRRLSFAELLDAADKITQLYLNKGYITSGAFIPRSEIVNGIVEIQILEGSIEQINIIGLERLNPGYVRARVAKATQGPINENKLLNSLRLLQLNPLIAGISARLAPGSKPGVSILNVAVTEADPFALQFTLDNQRSPIVGSFRRKISLEHLNLFGFGDRFTAGYVNTDGSNSLDNLSYTIPVNASNGTISFRHNRTASEPIDLQPAFDILEIASNTSDYNLTYRQPIYQTPNRELTLGATASLSLARSLAFLENEAAFPTTVEANENGEIRISALRLFQEYVSRDRRQVFAALSEFNLGLNIFDATIDNNPQFNLADSQFFSWRGQAQYLRLLNQQTPHTTLLLRGNLQIADDILLPREQFTLGGASSVRGYRQNALFGDNGLFLSAELRQPILSISKWDLDLQVTPFVDFGVVWNDTVLGETLPRNIPRDRLSSVGVGLLLNIDRDFEARLNWGIPFNDLGGEKRSLQEKGIYFNVHYYLRRSSSFPDAPSHFNK